MSPEFEMGDVTSSEIEGANKQVPSSSKPNKNRVGHWSSIEIAEWRKKIGEAFDQMAHLGDVARFEKEHGVEQHPKPNGMDRLTRLGDDLGKTVKVEEEEAEFGEEPMGYGPSVESQVESLESSKT